MNFIDLFAGIGGFRYGLERCNADGEKALPEDGLQSRGNKPDGKRGARGRRAYHCVWSNEWNKYCAKIYEKNFGEAPDTRDIRTVPSGEIPNHDLLCAGFPCQSFSVAGKRAGFEDTRGTLFFEIARVLRDKRPRHLLLENVKGLLSHQEGETFQTILGVLSDLGYRCEWQVLNSKHFGVPQNRERVFIVGHLGGGGGSQVFPVEQPDRADSANYETANCLDANYGKGWLDHGQRTMVIHDKRQAEELRIQQEPCVTKHYGTGGGNVPLVIGNIYPSKGQAGQILDIKRPSKAIVPAKRGGSAVMPIIHHQEIGTDIANTVDPDGYLRLGRRPRFRGKGILLPIGVRRIRRLTPTECERLQGFPDNFTKGVSDTQRYRMLGNAVTTNVITAIGERLLIVLQKSDKKATGA